MNVVKIEHRVGRLCLCTPTSSLEDLSRSLRSSFSRVKPFSETWRNFRFTSKDGTKTYGLQVPPAEPVKEEKMEEPQSPLPVSKGSYNIDFDNLDENINPFQTRSKVSDGFCVAVHINLMFHRKQLFSPRQKFTGEVACRW